MASLVELQRAMRSALHARQSYAALPLIAATASWSAVDRLHVYEDMVWVRLVRSLLEDFPVVSQRLGTELFERVAATHIARRPSTDPSLAWLGRGFEDTLRELGREFEASLARLEWARALAFLAGDAPAASAAELGALGETFGDAVLAFHPSLQVVAVRGGVLAAYGDPVGGAVDDEHETHVAVWRAVSHHGASVNHERLEPMEAAALECALEGCCMAAVCDAFSTSPSPAEDATRAVLRWIAAGWVSGVRMPPGANAP